MVAATIRSFFARDQLRRRCTDVITSTCVLVIGVVLGLLLGLAPMTESPQGDPHRVLAVWCTLPVPQPRLRNAPIPQLSRSHNLSDGE
jgi:hypothetical protein